MLSDTQTTVHSTRQARFMFLGLALYVLLLHAGLFIFYDAANNYAPFIMVDRANNRIDAMDNLFSVHSGSEFVHAIVTNNIIVGEYLLQSGLFALGGAPLVILFQIVLQLLSVLAVYRIARLLLNSPLLSFLTALIYASLPHSIAFPHQFASEAIGTPLVVLSFWLLIEYLIADALSAWLWLAGFLCGLASCIRPVMMLLPAAMAICVIAKSGPKAVRDALGLVITGAIAPVLVVGLFILATHQASLGNTMSSMGYNLYLRVMRITVTSGFSDADEKYIVDHYFSGDMNEQCIGNPIETGPHPCALPVPEYVSFVVHYPVQSIRYVVRDLITYVAKSGVSSLTANYFDMANDEQIKDYKNGWHAIWDSQGLYAAILMVLKANPAATLIELAGSGLFILLFACFLAGCRQVWRTRKESSRPRLIAFTALALFPMYVFATSEVSAFMLSRYRFPCEFAMCILAVKGGAAILSRLKTRSKSPHDRFAAA